MATQYKLFDWTVELAKFGETIRRERKRVGLSQSELAALVGVSDSHISTIERAAAPSLYLRTYVDLCNVFDLDVRAFFGFGSS